MFGLDRLHVINVNRWLETFPGHSAQHLDARFREPVHGRFVRTDTRPAARIHGLNLGRERLCSGHRRRRRRIDRLDRKGFLGGAQ